MRHFVCSHGTAAGSPLDRQESIDVVSRRTRLIAVLYAAGLTGLGAQIPVQPHAYVDDFGVEAPFIAPSNQLIATYYGWEGTTVFGHSIWAMTVDQYNADLANGCFSFYSQYRSGCSPGNADLAGVLGQRLFGPAGDDPLFNPALGGGKPYATDPVYCPNPAQACYGDPFSVQFTFTPGTEIVFALQVDQGIDRGLTDGQPSANFGTPDYNWFFSGDPSRNANADGDGGIGFAHLAYWPDGVGGNKGDPTPVPGTQGTPLFGWEDTGWINSDWDFNNAIFTVSPTPAGVIQSVTPEPATMTLLGAGLTGLSLLGRRRRRKVPAA
jgi:PEP-CTERM motif